MHLRVNLLRSLCGWIVLVVLAYGAGAAEPTFPALTGRVVDQAEILSGATRERLTGMLAAHEQATGEQVVVVTVTSLQGCRSRISVIGSAAIGASAKKARTPARC